MQLTAKSAHVSLTRQVNHWLQAALRLSELDQLASGNAWHGIEFNLAVLLRGCLQKSVDDVIGLARNILAQMQNGNDDNRKMKAMVVQLRERFLRTEESIHFYTVAINSRTTANIAALLRGCDVLCQRSMQQLLDQLGKKSPPVLTYIDKGIGASILKAGLHLWDGSVSPVAAIKITQHNLFRPTAIIHEAGHQVAHILNWNEELADKLKKGLNNFSPVVSSAFENWSPEIAADAFAFVHSGYAAVAALHDVLSGSPAMVMSFYPNDPHPISYVRVLMNIEMCRQFYGAGPWDELEEEFKSDYEIDRLGFSSTPLIKDCIAALPDAVRLILKEIYNAFGGKPLSTLIPPVNVSPQSLDKLESTAGAALFTSHAWIWKECLRLLALTGYKIALGEGDLSKYYKQQEQWMTILGFAVESN